jgi:hypothetical protein
VHYKLQTPFFSIFFSSSSSSILWIKARKATRQSDYIQIGFAMSFFFFFTKIWDSGRQFFSLSSRQGQCSVAKAGVVGGVIS